MRNIKKGEIYLANLGKKSEFDVGKIRPVLIFQNNFLNRMIGESLYQDVVVLPLSSKIRENEFVYFIKAKNGLEKDSIILCNAIRMIDASRILYDKGCLLKLKDEAILDIEKMLYKLFDSKINF